MTLVGKHSGGAPPPLPTGRLASYAAAVVAAALAWGVLVYYAIQLGPSAKAGELGAWLLLAVATLGAVGCLFLALIFGGKFLDTLRGEAPAPRPVTASGGKHGRR